MMRTLFLAILILLPASQAVPSTTISDNNPGHIIQTGVDWKGSIPCDSRFVCFSEPYYGIRAIVKNLEAYYETHGIRSVEAVIHRWMPETENDPDAVLDTLRRMAGDQTRVSLGTLTEWIIQIENGENPYGDLVDEVVEDVSSRDHYHFSFHRDLSVHEVPVQETGHEATTTRNEDGERTSSPESTDYQEIRISVDSPDYCTVSSSLDCCRSEDGRPVWMDGRYSDIRVDRGTRILGVQYRGMDMEDSGRTGHNPSRHPSHERNHWALLRREFSGPRQEVTDG